MREAEITTLANDTTVQLASIDADGIVLLVAGVWVRLMGGLDVRADAAVVEKIDAKFADGVLTLELHKTPESKPRRIEIKKEK